MKNSDNTPPSPYVIFPLSFLVYGGMGYVLMYYLGEENQNPLHFALFFGLFMAVWETFGAPKFKAWMTKRLNKKEEK